MKNNRLFSNAVLIISALGMAISLVKLSYLNMELALFGVGLFFISQFTIVSVYRFITSGTIEVTGEVKDIKANILEK